MAEVADSFRADRTMAGRPGGLPDVAARRCAGQAVVALAGELDMSGACQVVALVAAAAAGASWLIVDLTDLTFSDCAGARALTAAALRTRLAGGDLVLAAPRPAVLRLLDLTGLTTSVQVYPSVEAAAGAASG